MPVFRFTPPPSICPSPRRRPLRPSLATLNRGNRESGADRSQPQRCRRGVSRPTRQRFSQTSPIATYPTWTRTTDPVIDLLASTSTGSEGALENDVDSGSPSSQQPRKRLRQFKEDRLSSLPKNVIDTILVSLPIRDAVRTSVLSRAWRHEWTNISQIVFKKSRSQPGAKESHKDCGRKVVNIVDQVLLLHQGPLHKFKLSVELHSSHHIDRWTQCVSKKSIKEFTLDVFKGPIYILHSCLFSCQGITHLELYWCSMVPPASFNGFRNLKTLDLQSVSFLDNGLDNLISSCPLLNKLRLRHIIGCTHIKLCAPNLVDLEVESRFEDICFEKTPILAKASIELLPDEEYQIPPVGGICKLVDLLGCLPDIRRLELLGQSYQMLSLGDVPVTLPNECWLSYFSANMNFGHLEDMSIALCILRSSPFLQEVYIESISNTITGKLSVEAFWEAKESFDCLLPELQILNVAEYSGTNAELRFVEFVLARAPVLERVQIKLKEDTDDGMDILKKLIRLRRVSSKTEIVIP